jgi:hypothetical protein
MKRMKLFFTKSLTMAFVVFFIVSCDEKGLEIPIYEMLPVSRYERDTLNTLITYDNGRITGYKLHVRDALVSETTVAYKPSGIYCSLNGISYEIKLDHTIGGSRVEYLRAHIDNMLYYEVRYRYDDEGRLSSAEINAQGGPYYTSYRYHESSVEIIDEGIFEIPLGNEENTGHVFNVLDHANAFLTSNYVINPELYFLNIYGKPVGKLPHGSVIERSGNTLRVGKHYYEYATEHLYR